MILLLVVARPADAVAAKDLGAAVAEGHAPVPAMILVLPRFRASLGVPVAACPWKR